MAMDTTLRLRTDHLTKMRTLAKLNTLDSLATAMGTDPGNVSRVLAGKQSPGPRFMASLVACFPGYNLDDLFEIVNGNE